VDSSSERRAFVAQNFPGVEVVSSVEKVFNDETVQGVIIATPAASHFELALSALRAGKHVFVEKPLATRVSEVDVLAEAATTRSLIVMVGHTFLYNPAVRHVKDMIDRGELGQVRYIYSQRLNLGRIRSDIDALWNFAPHDISIVQYWLGEPDPVNISRAGMSYIQPEVDDVVFLNVLYPHKIMAHIHVSWLDPQKVRKMVVVGSRKMVVYDDISEDKISVCDKGIERRAVLGENMDFDTAPNSASTFSYRSGDVLLPHIAATEPLRVEAQHFLDCIRTRSAPLSGIPHARRVVAILEAAAAIRGRR
jgi:predicted dehydrogenase